MAHVERDGYLLTTDPDRVDVAAVHRWLSTDAYWALGRDEDTVRRSLAGSRPYSVWHGDEQVAIARVVTDGATFAWICDVYVAESHRGRGLGGWLVATLVEELQVSGVQRFLLATRDAHEVYRRAGFVPLEGAWRWMEIDRRPTRDAIVRSPEAGRTGSAGPGQASGPTPASASTDGTV